MDADNLKHEKPAQRAHKTRNLDPAYVNKLENLDPVEAAIILRSSASTLAKYRCFGGGPEFIRVSPRKVIYTRAALDAWIANRAKTGTWRGAA